jgi:hypothetical protein
MENQLVVAASAAAVNSRLSRATLGDFDTGQPLGCYGLKSHRVGALAMVAD